MDEEKVKLYNTGIVKPEYVRNITHFFCRAVVFENERQECKGDLRKAVDMVKHSLINYSAAHADRTGICEVTWKDDLLKIFFDQQNTIPAYIYYWLHSFYDALREYKGDIADYSERHYDIYNKLQKEYIDHYRFSKKSDKEEAIWEKQQRRKLCKRYCSGEYADTFRLYGKSLSDIVTHDELEKVSLMISMLFGREIDGMDEDEQYAAAYLIGRMQGRDEVLDEILRYIKELERSEQNTINTVPVLNIKQMSDETWNQLAAIQRAKHPELYRDAEADVVVKNAEMRV